MRKGAAARDPKMQRVSPGVYRNSQGNLVRHNPKPQADIGQRMVAQAERNVPAGQRGQIGDSMQRGLDALNSMPMPQQNLQGQALDATNSAIDNRQMQGIGQVFGQQMQGFPRNPKWPDFQQMPQMPQMPQGGQYMPVPMDEMRQQILQRMQGMQQMSPQMQQGLQQGVQQVQQGQPQMVPYPAFYNYNQGR